MKAFLLAAGLGSRLGRLTERTPKCMLPIGGRPLLDIWLDSLGRAGVDEVLVNVHHLADVVCRFLNRRQGPPHVRIAPEPELLGSAGTLAANRHWVESEDMFLACNADNLTDLPLRSFADAHREGAGIATIGVFRSERPTECGIVEVDGAGRMVGFAEKPRTPSSELANAGIYAFHPSVVAEIEGPIPQDIGHHLLPRLVGRARVFEVHGFLMDVGTPDAYRRARREWPAVVSAQRDAGLAPGARP